MKATRPGTMAYSVSQFLTPPIDEFGDCDPCEAKELFEVYATLEEARQAAIRLHNRPDAWSDAEISRVEWTNEYGDDGAYAPGFRCGWVDRGHVEWIDTKTDGAAKRLRASGMR